MTPEKENRCVVCGRKKENGKPYFSNQECFICMLDMARLLRTLMKRRT